MERTRLEFEGADGLTLVGDATGDPAQAPVVFFHGGGQTRHSWRETVDALAVSGWYAVSVDLRGHGDSDWSPDGDYGHVGFTEDVVRIARSFDVPPVLVGASLGGISSLLALGATTGAPQAIARALVLVDIATRMEAAGAERIISFMASRPDGFESLEDAADAVASYNPHRRRPKSLDGLARNLRKHEDGRYRWHWDPAFIEGRHGNAEQIHDPELLDRAAASLEVPTLLVRGRLSDLLSKEGADAFLAQVPHARFADVSGAGHMVAGDQNDAFSNAVLDFLRSL